MKMNYFKFFNSNPNQKYHKNGSPMKWHGTDCTIRSLSCSMSWSWLESFDFLVSFSRELQMTYDDINVLKKGYTKLGFKKHSMEKGVKPSVNQFCQLYPKGTYILSLCGHVVCVKDGYFYDTWDCGEYKVRSFYEKV